MSEGASPQLGRLVGRVAVVTGVSRRRGIGFAIARRLLSEGASVLVQSWAAHDAEQPWGADEGGVAGVLEALVSDDEGNVDAELGARLAHAAADLEDPSAPASLVAAAVAHFGALDIVVANHARSSSQDLEHVTAEELDRSFAVNARASILLAQALAAIHDDERPGGRIVLFSSGQHLAPQPSELAYVASKGAIQQVTRSLADQLASRRITVNCVNPGPTDTGWASPELLDIVRDRLPAGRWGSPDDAARLVAWLVSDDAAWITGQTINSDGGFRYWGDPT